MGNGDFGENPEIYTTGAYLRPLKITDGQGEELWVWYVSNFDGDSFNDGEVFNPKENARNKKDLTDAKA